MDVDIELQARLLLRERITDEKSGVTEHTLKEPDTTHTHHTHAHTHKTHAHSHICTCEHTDVHMHHACHKNVHLHILVYILSFKLALPVSPFSNHVQCDWRGCNSENQFLLTYNTICLWF